MRQEHASLIHNYERMLIAIGNCSIHIVRANMHCQCIEYSRSFYTGLTSAEDQKLERFKGKVMNNNA